MASNEKEPNAVEIRQGMPIIPSVFTSSIPQQRYGETSMNLPDSAPLSSLYYKNNLNLGSSEPSNRLQLLDRSMMVVQNQQQRQDTTNYELLQNMLLRIHNDRESAALSLHQQQSAAVEEDYLRRIHLQRMVEISMQEMQKRDEAVFHLENVRFLSSAPRNNKSSSPPSGAKRASSA